MMQQYRRTLWPVLALCFLSFAGMALAQESARGSGAADEVVISGNRSTSSLRKQAERLTLDFYDKLNVAIGEEEFRVNCRMESHARTRIQRRVCRTRYEENAQARQASQRIGSLRIDQETAEVLEDGNIVEIDQELRQKKGEFVEKFSKVVNSDPAMNRKFWELRAVMQEIESRKGRPMSR